MSRYSQPSKLCFSNSICVNVHRYYKTFSIFLNIPQYYLSGRDDLADDCGHTATVGGVR